MITLFINTFTKMFFLLTPFLLLSMFLGMTRQVDREERRHIATRTLTAILTIVLILFYFGNIIFKMLGLTIEAFQIGAGALLFLSSMSLVQNNTVAPPKEGEDISVVPLALPLTVGPGTIGALLVLGSQLEGMDKMVASAALIAAVLTVGAMLWTATTIERHLGTKGLSVLMKLTGLILAALAAQLMFTGFFEMQRSFGGLGLSGH